MIVGAWLSLLLGVRLEDKVTLEAELKASKSKRILKWGKSFDECQDDALEHSFDEADEVSEDYFSLLEEVERI